MNRAGMTPHRLPRTLSAISLIALTAAWLAPPAGADEGELKKQERGRYFDIWGTSDKGVKVVEEVSELTGKVFVKVWGRFSKMKGAIVLDGETPAKLPEKMGGAKWTFRWKLSELPEKAGDENALKLSRALGLAMMVRKIDGDETPKGFGSSLPDWIDVAAMHMADPESVKVDSRRRMKFMAQSKLHVPFAEFFRKEYPGDGGDEDTKRAATLFRAQSLSYAEYAFVNFGDDYLEDVIKTLSKGKPMSATVGWFKKHASKLKRKNIPVFRYMNEVEDHWSTWAQFRDKRVDDNK